jgi:hypothetical protein
VREAVLTSPAPLSRTRGSGRPPLNDDGAVLGSWRQSPCAARQRGRARTRWLRSICLTACAAPTGSGVWRRLYAPQSRGLKQGCRRPPDPYGSRSCSSSAPTVRSAEGDHVAVVRRRLVCCLRHVRQPNGSRGLPSSPTLSVLRAPGTTTDKRELRADRGRTRRCPRGGLAKVPIGFQFERTGPHPDREIPRKMGKLCLSTARLGHLITRRSRVRIPPPLSAGDDGDSTAVDGRKPRTSCGAFVRLAPPRRPRRRRTPEPAPAFP